MNYQVTVASQTYPVEDPHLPTERVLEHDPEGQPFSFISPIRLNPGLVCVLAGDAGGYELIVNGCVGFAYSLRFLVTGTIAARHVGRSRF